MCFPSVISGFEGSSPDACDMTTNIALNRPSQESSLYYFLGVHIYLRAAAANDLTTGTNLEQCSHTEQEYQVYFWLHVRYAWGIPFYYPPRDIFALNTGKYRPGYIYFFIYRRLRTMDNLCS